MNNFHLEFYVKSHNISDNIKTQFNFSKNNSYNKLTKLILS